MKTSRVFIPAADNATADKMLFDTAVLMHYYGITDKKELFRKVMNKNEPVVGPDESQMKLYARYRSQFVSGEWGVKNNTPPIVFRLLNTDDVDKYGKSKAFSKAGFNGEKEFVSGKTPSSKPLPFRCMAYYQVIRPR
jgi:hypothetical protein